MDPVSEDYELGRLLACQGDEDGARKHLQLVLSGLSILLLTLLTIS